MSSQRLNARIDAELAQKLEQLREATGQTTTEVIRRAIELYHADTTSAGTSSLQALKNCGFVGSAEGPRDLSERYKSRLGESLVGKI